MKNLLLSIVFIGLSFNILSQDSEYDIKLNIPYYSDSINESDAYIKDRCVLDIYYPKNEKGNSVIIWFHGGELMYGNKEFPEALKNKGICIVAVNYRLNPKVNAPEYIKDAAAAVAWTFNNINDFGGDSSLIFVSGHSAGAYLALMIGLDKRWLKTHDIDANRIAGLIPFSGNAITHITVRKERNIPATQPVIDELAPLYHVRADAPPLLLVTGDRELELLGRYEENAYLMRMMKVVGHKETKIYELDGYGHIMTEPAFPLLVEEVKRITKNKRDCPPI